MWLSIFITETKNIKSLSRRIELTPEALELVWVFRVVMKWGWDPDVPHDWKLCGPPEDWFFEDRRDKKEEWLKRNAVPEVFWQWPNLPFDDWDALPDDRPPLPGPSEMNDWDPEHFKNWWKNTTATTMDKRKPRRRTGSCGKECAYLPGPDGAAIGEDVEPSHFPLVHGGNSAEC
jgi:hypothetical protein